MQDGGRSAVSGQPEILRRSERSASPVQIPCHPSPILSPFPLFPKKPPQKTKKTKNKSKNQKNPPPKTPLQFSLPYAAWPGSTSLSMQRHASDDRGAEPLPFISSLILPSRSGAMSLAVNGEAPLVSKRTSSCCLVTQMYVAQQGETPTSHGRISDLKRSASRDQGCCISL